MSTNSSVTRESAGDVPPADLPLADLPLADLPLVQPGRGFDLLRGIRVLDLTTSVAGPFATMLLADFGAEVIKVERPGSGDDARAWGPPFLDGESLWFLSVNRNKRSIALDYSTEEGRAVLHDLIRHSDAILLNQPPRVARKLGLDPDSVKALRPDIVYTAITGFGLSGERADWTCYDLIAEGYSGVMDVTGPGGGEPQKVGTPAADMLAGQDAALATVAALFARQAGGPGRVIDVALVDSMTRFLTCRIVPYLGSGEVPTRSGGTDSVIAIYQAFDTADAPITLGLGNDNLWSRFWQAVGQPEVAAEPGFASNAERRARRPEIVARIGAILATKPRAHWLSVFRAARIPAGPINRVDEIAADPTMHGRGMVYRVEREDGSAVPQVGTGIQLDGAFNRPRSAPPRLGEHSQAVLADVLGYDRDKISRLAAADVI
ncbi:CaiB/BaiF CoA transferase family protein [Methylobacterium frigidaeris]|uniref:Acetyl-CoA:oxalate CoA-transferase n=1 Tax=Methylobacterium frigidaeris TaxID=2038277 RepID=A0AA37HH70_9HYPH|nr:CoA transferase [Methylobacterium frigidaeris]PIK73015.1 CoA transferase [Methylobacterium frigidaeris]GJD66027.1 Acetyl-CoA:oxalate CoA-transferase [Methylobacterium frigidaeris]